MTTTETHVSAPRDRGGFTMIEVMVALIILTVGVLGLAATTIWVVRQTTLAELTTERSAAVQTVVEQLRASDYTSITAGTDSVGRFDVSWSVTDGNRSKLVTLITTGPGLAGGTGMPSLSGAVADTFAYRIMQP
ncbi:MAG: prepilin-type N-terminal cleavage/methylation domain-containing protein [Gemmatimonadota bacterium]